MEKVASALRLPNSRKIVAQIVALGLLGILVRIAFVWLHPEPFIYDQVEYRRYALGMLSYGLYAEPARVYGYPLIIAIVYRLFGQSSCPWQMMQIVMDSCTGILLYVLGGYLFKNRSAGIIASFLYTINPFTAAFTGVMLSEVTATFLIAVLMFTIMAYLRTKKFLYALSTAFVIGFLPAVRPSFFYFSVGLFVLLQLYTLFSSGRVGFHKIVRSGVLFLLFLLPFVYTIIGNYVNYRRISFVTAGNLFVREVYLSLFLDRAPLYPSTFSYPPEVYAIWNEPAWVSHDPNLMSSTENKYWQLSKEIIGKNPAGFLFSRVKKAWYVWEKHAIFYYTPETASPFVHQIIYYTNFFLLVACFLGILLFSFTSLNVNRKILVSLGIFILIYISVVYMASTSEERFSLPGYPVVFLFAGYFLARVLRKFVRMQ